MAQSFEGLRGWQLGAARVQSFECCGLSACGPGRRVRICPPLATEGLKEYMARAENGKGQGQPHMLYFFPSHFPTSSHQIVVGIALAKLYSADRLRYCSLHSASHFPTSSHRTDMVNRCESDLICLLCLLCLLCFACFACFALLALLAMLAWNALLAWLGLRCLLCLLCLLGLICLI